MRFFKKSKKNVISQDGLIAVFGIMYNEFKNGKNERFDDLINKNLICTMCSKQYHIKSNMIFREINDNSRNGITYKEEWLFTCPHCGNKLALHFQ